MLPGCAGGIREDSIGNELDIQYNYNYNENLSFELGFSQLFSGDLLDNLVQVAPGGVPAPPAGVVTASADDPMRIWGQARLRW
ncbi:MAG: hypothetical protein ACE5ID_10480 [Acidobacteriota bacterium]